MSMDPERHTLNLMLPHRRWGFWRQDSTLIFLTHCKNSSVVCSCVVRCGGAIEMFYGWGGLLTMILCICWLLQLLELPPDTVDCLQFSVWHDSWHMFCVPFSWWEITIHLSLQSLEDVSGCGLVDVISSLAMTNVSSREYRCFIYQSKFSCRSISEILFQQKFP